MKITMNWNDLGINEMTNLFLYGSLNTPTNLQDESLLNHETVDLTLTDVASFMIDGPGRFVNAAYFSLIHEFMAGRIMPKAVRRFRDSKPPSIYPEMADCLSANPPYSFAMVVLGEIHACFGGRNRYEPNKGRKAVSR